jgi:hypothetical protein
MTKSIKPKTHFEQVPLEIVKDIADQDIAKDQRGKTDSSAKSPAKEAAPLRPSRPGRGQGRHSPK